MKAKQILFLTFISFQVYSQKLDILIHKADSALNKGNVTIALQLYSKAIKIDTNNAYLYIRRGMCFNYLDQAPSAIKDLNRGLNRSDLLENRLLAIKERGTANGKLKNYTSQLQDLILWGCYNQHNYENRNLIDNCLDHISNHDSSLLAINTIISSNDSVKDKSLMYYMRSFIENENEMYNEQIDDLIKVKNEFIPSEKRDSLLEAYYILNYNFADAYLNLDSLNRALKHINKTISIFPKYQYAYLLRSKIYTEMEEYEKAKEDLRTLEYDLPLIFDLNYHWGIWNLKQDKFNEAIKSFKNAPNLSKSTYTNYLIGFCYSQLKDYKQSRKYFDKSLELDGSQFYIYEKMAWDFIDQKNYEEAKRYSAIAKSYGSNEIHMLYQDACILFETGKYQECIPLFSEVIESMPLNLIALKYKARANIKLNNNKDACSDIEMIKIVTLNANFSNEDEDIKQFSEKYCK